MLYLTGSLPARADLFRALEQSGHVGALITPRNSYPSKPLASWQVAADNGCFGANWNADEWREWVAGVRTDVLFATVPDVVGDWRGTRNQWDVYRSDVERPAAYVLQDGQPAEYVPWGECDAVFIGGSTDYKLSLDAHALVVEAHARGKWVHMGRVNTWERIQLAHRWGCDSVDGNYIAFGPDINVPRLLSWLRRIHNAERQLTLC